MAATANKLCVQMHELGIDPDTESARDDEADGHEAAANSQALWESQVKEAKDQHSESAQGDHYTCHDDGPPFEPGHSKTTTAGFLVPRFQNHGHADCEHENGGSCN